MPGEVHLRAYHRFAWGRLEIAGGKRFKDAKLFPGASREWDWSETGTDHVPGIRPADVEELLQHGTLVAPLHMLKGSCAFFMGKSADSEVL
jgi:hypothetical protein